MYPYNIRIFSDCHVRAMTRAKQIGKFYALLLAVLQILSTPGCSAEPPAGHFIPFFTSIMPGIASGP